MRTISLLLLAAGMFPVSGYAQEQQQPAQQAPQEAPQKPPRVIGQAQTQEEFDVWTQIESAATLQEKAQLAEDFLAKFPESGLTPFVHQVAALAYQQSNHYEKFVEHAEKTLAELPNNALVLTGLAIAYSQRGKPDLAMEKAQQGLQVIDSMQKPLDVVQGLWDAQLDQLRSDANYALGTAYFDKYLRASQVNKNLDTATEPNLGLALEHLQTALKQDPRYDAAYFRLANIFSHRNDAGNAMLNYARAAALNGAIASIARENLQKIYEIVNPKKENESDEQYRQRVSQELDQMIAAERSYVLKRIEDKQQAQPPTPPLQ